MKKLYLLTAIIVSLIIIQCKSINQKVKSELVFKVILKGNYFSEDSTCGGRYYLAEANLINNTDSVCEFVTMSCASLISIVTDSKDISFLYHTCSANYPTTVRLKPKQEFSIPIIFSRKNSVKNIKLGFVYANRKNFFDVPTRKLRKMNEKKENVIWSEPINLSVANFHPYEIREVISNSSFTIIEPSK